MIIKIEGTSRLYIETDGKGGPSKLKSVEIILRTEASMEHQMFGADGLPTPDGVKALTQVFIQGLNANIQSAHQAGKWDSAQHLRYIIKNLEEAFVRTVETTVAPFESFDKKP